MGDAGDPPDWTTVEPKRRCKGGGELRSQLHRAERVEVPAAARQLSHQLTALDRRAARLERARRCEAHLFLHRQLERRRRAERLYQAARSAACRPESPPGRGRRRQRAAWRPRRSTLPSPSLAVSLSVSSLQLVLLDWPPPPPPPGRPRSSSAPSVLVDALWEPGQHASHCLSPPSPRRRPLSGERPPPAAARRQLRDSFCRELARRTESEGELEEVRSLPPPEGTEAEEDPVEAVLERLRRTLVTVEQLPPPAASRRCSRAGPQTPPRRTPVLLRLTGSTAPY